MTRCLCSIHQGRSVPVLVERSQITGEVIGLVCQQAGGVLGCGFHIAKRWCTEREWQQVWALWGPEPEIAYNDSGVNNAQI